jgi:hypothetical protein
LEASSQFQDSPLLVDGRELTQILIVGRVNKVLSNIYGCVDDLQVNVTATAVLYSLDDGSGIIDVKKYTEQNEDDNMGTSIEPIQ